MSNNDASISLGMIIYSSVKPIFKIYFIIALGFYLAKKNILTVTTCRDISDTVVSAIMPCLIFENIVSNLQSSDIKNIGIIFFTGTLLFMVGITLALLTYIFTGSPKRWLGGLASVGLFPNISDLPIAYLQTMSKGGIFTPTEVNKGIAYVCIFLASQIFYQFCLGFNQLIEWDFRDELKPHKDEENSSTVIDDETDHNIVSTSNNSEAASFEESSILNSISSSESQNEKSKGASSSADTTNKNSNHRALEVEDNQHYQFLKLHEMQKLTSNSRTSISSTSNSSLRSRPRRGSNSQNSLSSNHYLQLSISRTNDLRQQRSQDIRDVINEYSEYEALKHSDIRRSVTGSDIIGVEHIDKSKKASKSRSNIREILIQFAKNFAAPNSVSLIISIAIAMSPPLKALFVETDNFHIPPAPDKQPPLSFIIDLTSYIGAASVPLGLLLLGATISRLSVKKMPPGFWKTAVAITASRLILMPIIGVGLTTGLYKAGWYGDDKLLRFVSVLEYGLPNATVLVYLTAFYTDPTSEDHLQMDCLAICLIYQYSILFITLPFLITFTFTVSLGL